jgi:hydroxyacylglutathione hydrolase
MIHEILPVGMFEMNCQLVGDESTGEALVIDPGDEFGVLRAAVEKHSLRVTQIVFTHTHIDHVGAAASMKSWTGAPVAMHRKDLPVYESLAQQAKFTGLPEPERVEIARWLEEGDSVLVGSIAFEVRFTPGHSPGSISLWSESENLVITGDALFRGSVGRTDLPGGNHEQLIASIRKRLLSLPDSASVYPGHGRSTTIGAERRSNPFLL